MTLTEEEKKKIIEEEEFRASVRRNERSSGCLKFLLVVLFLIVMGIFFLFKALKFAGEFPSSESSSKIELKNFEATAKEFEAEKQATIAAQSWSEVDRWEGSGIKETQPFTITGDRWRISWAMRDSSDAVFQIFVNDASGNFSDLVASVYSSSGKDVTYKTGAGTYSLKVNTSAENWRLGVEELR